MRRNSCMIDLRGFIWYGDEVQETENRCQMIRNNKIDIQIISSKTLSFINFFNYHISADTVSAYDVHIS